MSADAEAVAEYQEIARIVRQRTDMAEIPLAEVARRFGIDLDEI